MTRAPVGFDLDMTLIDSRRAIMASFAGVAADDLFTDVHGPQKAAVLAGLGAAAYVGDTPADMTAAVQAGARAVGVTTGSFTESELRVAGADLVLASLDAFPALYPSLGAVRSLRAPDGGWPQRPPRLPISGP